MSDEIPEVNAKRRRRGSQPTGQASRPVRRETPSRPTSSSSGGIGMTPPPTSGSGGSGWSGSSSSSGGGSYGSGGLGGGLGSLLGGLGSATSGKRGGRGSIVGIILLLLVIFFLFRMCSGGTSLLPQVEQETPAVTQPNQDDSFVLQQPTPDDTVIQPFSPTAIWPTPIPSNNSGKTWLVMLYQDADDNALERDILIDFNEAEMIGSTDQVMVVSQLDRYRGGYSGDGDWSTAHRYLVTYDDNLNSIGSDLIADIGEVNMGDADTLVDFVSWAASTYPADNYVLIMSDHGMGWPGGWSDPSPAQKDNSSNAPLTSALQDDILYLNEIEGALRQIKSKTNIDKFELIGMDACLMSQMEVYSALAPYTKYAVASEETEPGLGWAYSAFLSLMVYNPDLSTEELATNIVDSYISQDQRVLDDQARAEFLAQNSSGGGWFVNRMSAEQLAQQLEQNITLTASTLRTSRACLIA